MTQSIALNIAKLQQRTRFAEKKYHRQPHSVQIMAVSKTRTAAEIRQAAAAGIIEIGENYLQEARQKQQQLSDLPLNWHFIGPIQSNKTQPIADHFDWVHSVDRIKIARRLSNQRADKPSPLNICLQINISDEKSKSGFCLDELYPAALEISQLPHLQLRGLMAIPQASNDEQQQRQAFSQLAAAFERLQQRYPSMDTLSIGMSADWEAAVAEGATIIRIGTGIFGPRR